MYYRVSRFLLGFLRRLREQARINHLVIFDVEHVEKVGKLYFMTSPGLILKYHTSFERPNVMKISFFKNFRFTHKVINALHILM